MKNKLVKKEIIHPDNIYSPSIDKVGVEERVARFQSRSIKNESKFIRFISKRKNTFR